MCGGLSLIGLFFITLGLATTYAITTFGLKLSLQSKMKDMKSKMKAVVMMRRVYTSSYRCQLAVLCSMLPFIAVKPTVFA
jgi:hypothetical protein